MFNFFKKSSLSEVRFDWLDTDIHSHLLPGIDDGSPDSCGAICDEYAARDSRVLALHKPNGGLSSARNFALPYIEDCPLVTFVDSDDWLEPGGYEQAVCYLIQHPEVAIVGYGAQ